MRDIDSKSYNLAPDIALTERSRKFYDGTYKWDSEGFTDDDGGKHNEVSYNCRILLTAQVHRSFDCYDPLARAPTPLPPMFSDEEDEEGATADVKARLPSDVAQQSTVVNKLRLKRYNVIESCLHKSGCSKPPSDDPGLFTFASEYGGDEYVTVDRENIFMGEDDREYLVGKMEGVLNASRYVC